MDTSALASILAQAKVEPRPYQSRIVHKTVSMFQGTYRNGAGELEPPARSVMIESPTGSGKSVMGLLAAKALQLLTGARVGWVAMRRNLLQQAQAENQSKGINVEPIRFISMFEKNPPTDIDLLVEDEGHHQAANSMAHLHNLIKPKWILGLTATPFRTDYMHLSYDKIIKDAGVHQLVADGFLSQYDHFTVPRWDLQLLTDFYCAEPERWGKSLFFFQTVAECFAFNRIMQDRGFSADVVTGVSNRESQLDAFRRGELQVLSNCMVLTEGFDDCSLKTVWVRPSGRGPTVQMAGRALRKCDGLAAKQIVQCRQTRYPFTKCANPRQQYLWNPDGWRSLTVNPHLQLASNNACRLIAKTVVALPKFLVQKQERRPRRIRR
jgi:superfamily II DNA or RNA helicase